MRQAVFAVDAEQPLYDVLPFDEVIAVSIAARRFSMWLLGIFAAGALALASVGIFGVVSYMVTQRTQEFGVRIALGARPVDIMGNAMSRALPMIGIGMVAGLMGAMSVTRLLSSFLYGVRSSHVATSLAAPLLLPFFPPPACYLPP